MGYLRFQLVTNILPTATVVAHGLPGTPTEYGFAPSMAGASAPYFLGVSSTNLVLAAPVGGITGLVAASIPHSIIA